MCMRVCVSGGGGEWAGRRGTGCKQDRESGNPLGFFLSPTIVPTQIKSGSHEHLTAAMPRQVPREKGIFSNQRNCGPNSTWEWDGQGGNRRNRRRNPC